MTFNRSLIQCIKEVVAHFYANWMLEYLLKWSHGASICNIFEMQNEFVDETMPFGRWLINIEVHSGARDGKRVHWWVQVIRPCFHEM